ncbi:hypothetical protein EVAR_85401_1 [Eumeta japonica]|uniref:Uncharacterized protein n=1 Tax=Eumeta variegata TaxID=151549 RepID=A0A4C1SJX2_EUMVA|nr:hypothetical protein EVAR_85401_1 [Eumeta japonica]
MYYPRTCGRSDSHGPKPRSDLLVGFVRSPINWNFEDLSRPIGMDAVGAYCLMDAPVASRHRITWSSCVEELFRHVPHVFGDRGSLSPYGGYIVPDVPGVRRRLFCRSCFAEPELVECPGLAWAKTGAAYVITGRMHTL